jgi:N-acetylglutamate synthase/N-acetylornithine aminotransferase
VSETIDSFSLAKGFRATATACGLKTSSAMGASSLDMALVAADGPCSAAGIFTTNKVKAAPVRYDQNLLSSNAGAVRAVVVNAGNANACTGPQGDADCQRMAELTAYGLRCAPEQILVLSTGVIGRPMDMEKVTQGIAQLTSPAAVQGAPSAARAIMTTDTRPKTAMTTIDVGGRTVTIAGFCKGAGMIHPNMATMLAVITTDARVPAELLDRALREAAALSFNRLSVDGDTSTNDTVLLLASGTAEIAVSHPAEGLGEGTPSPENTTPRSAEGLGEGTPSPENTTPRSAEGSGEGAPSPENTTPRSAEGLGEGTPSPENTTPRSAEGLGEGTPSPEGHARSAEGLGEGAPSPENTTPQSLDWHTFVSSLTKVCQSLAKQVARDGEGATRLVEITVTGARTVAEAHQVANSIARSPLVKTAIHGGDPNWGRVVCAAGYSGANIEPDRLSLSFGPADRYGDNDSPAVTVVSGGLPTNADLRQASAAMRGDPAIIELDLGLGSAQATVWTCDLSAEYVSINAHYTT